MPVSEIKSGQTASFALKKIKRSQIRKGRWPLIANLIMPDKLFIHPAGMVMVSPKLNPQSCWEFEGDIMVLHHPTTIATRYRRLITKKNHSPFIVQDNAKFRCQVPGHGALRLHPPDGLHNAHVRRLPPHRRQGQRPLQVRHQQSDPWPIKDHVFTCGAACRSPQAAFHVG